VVFFVLAGQAATRTSNGIKPVRGCHGDALEGTGRRSGWRGVAGREEISFPLELELVARVFCLANESRWTRFKRPLAIRARARDPHSSQSNRPPLAAYILEAVLAKVSRGPNTELRAESPAGADCVPRGAKLRGRLRRSQAARAVPSAALWETWMSCAERIAFPEHSNILVQRPDQGYSRHPTKKEKQARFAPQFGFMRSGGPGFTRGWLGLVRSGARCAYRRETAALAVDARNALFRMALTGAGGVDAPGWKQYVGGVRRDSVREEKQCLPGIKDKEF